MAMSVTYATVNGQLVYEDRGGVETYYLNDPLGNVVQCHDATGAKTYEAWYWPYGEVRVSTGSNPSPWGFVGSLGYYTDDNSHIYVRARTYRPDLARWLTADPLWPNEPAYSYCQAAPISRADSSGMSWLDVWKRWREFFAACIASGAIATFFNYLSSGGALPDGSSICASLGSCLGAIVALALTIAFPESIDCIAQIFGSLAATLVDALCNLGRHHFKPCEPRRNPWCYLFDFVANAIGGCFGSPSDISTELGDTIASIVGQFSGNAVGGGCDALSR